MRAGRRTTRSGPRWGITLLELLIVMVILLMITAAAIPIIAPATRNRQMREGTRLVSAYLGAARARAVQTGRPAGIMIERFNPSFTTNGGAFALQMSQIEVPPPYSGDMVGSKASVVAGAPTGSLTTNRATSVWPYVEWFKASIPAAEFNNKLIRVGDTIQFGGQGHTYIIFGPDEVVGSTPDDGVIDNTTLEIAYVSRTPFAGKVYFPWMNTAPLPVPQPTPYKVFRQPVRTNTPPLVLPEGIVVDLSVSGVGSTLFNVQSYSGSVGTPPQLPLVKFDPQIIFSPSGRLEWVTNTNGQLTHPTDSVYLLLGRRELMFDATASVPAVDKDIVFQNLSPIPNPPTTPQPPAQNFWVTIGYQTGQVTVAEVAPHFQDYTGSSGATTLQDVINLTLYGNATYGGARAYARQSQSVGGR